ncbi:hypothetical protein OH77DRAFT_473108 [Trametes cingulata]|nr:hypothetical protein OH77DRAFT_473108 [Trametes cingulata]
MYTGCVYHVWQLCGGLTFSELSRQVASFRRAPSYELTHLCTVDFPPCTLLRGRRAGVSSETRACVTHGSHILCKLSPVGHRLESTLVVRPLAPKLRNNLSDSHAVAYHPPVPSAWTSKTLPSACAGDGQFSRAPRCTMVLRSPEVVWRADKQPFTHRSDPPRAHQVTWSLCELLEAKRSDDARRGWVASLRAQLTPFRGPF